MTQSFEPKFAGYRDRVAQSLRDQPFMHVLLGAVARRVEPGYVEITLPVTDNLRQPHGHVHGIVASAVGDSAAGYAAQTLMAEDQDVVTVEYKINYLRPGFGETIVAVGKVMRPGRTLFYCTADIFAVTGDEQQQFAHLVTTMMAVRDES